jgi:hypothetical protein
MFLCGWVDLQPPTRTCQRRLGSPSVGPVLPATAFAALNFFRDSSSSRTPCPTHSSLVSTRAVCPSHARKRKCSQTFKYRVLFSHARRCLLRGICYNVPHDETCSCMCSCAHTSRGWVASAAPQFPLVSLAPNSPVKKTLSLLRTRLPSALSCSDSHAHVLIICQVAARKESG